MSLREFDARDSFHGLSCTHVCVSPLLSLPCLDLFLFIAISLSSGSKLKMMMNSMFSCLQRKVSEIKAGVVVDNIEETQVVYRDELITKRRQARGAKKSVRFAEAEATVMGDSDDEKSEIKKRISSEGEGIRVKVKMTKEEAARLLGKCKEGGVLEFKDVARELLNIPVDRVSVMPQYLHKQYIKDPTL
ncbi:uncharacterized protein G2W53_019305 [Senna tora]|uniref:DUF7890 domain-containing protein n=1 Tax=Senna tora TaxID=362788 RepID=A0A834WQK4_9FABA|nr:uncharacterized protein G2W53_019305 [Senna tora]